MNQLTTTNNKHFTVETSIMEKILDASGYNFHVLTIDGHRYWIGRELVNAFDHAKNKGSMNMFNSMDRKDVHTIRLTKLNGMKELKDILLQSAWTLKIHPKTLWNEASLKKTHFLSLVREDTLQEYLTLYTRKPDAKEIGKKLYETLASGNPIFNEEVLDDWGTSIDELQKTCPQLFDASKKVNGFIFGLVGNRELANESKSWMSFLLSLAIKSVQIQFSTETRF